MKLIRNVIIVALCIIIAICSIVIAGESFPPAKGETAQSIATGKIWLQSAVLIATVSLLLVWITSRNKGCDIR